MSDLLAAVHAEIAELEGKLATLRDMERLARQLVGDAPGPKRRRAKARPNPAVRNGNGSNGVDATKGVYLKRRIKDMLAQEGLTELRLVEATGADREEVADQCGRLLLDDEITLDPDGTYRLDPAA